MKTSNETKIIEIPGDISDLIDDCVKNIEDLTYIFKTFLIVEENAQDLGLLI